MLVSPHRFPWKFLFVIFTELDKSASILYNYKSVIYLRINQQQLQKNEDLFNQFKCPLVCYDKKRDLLQRSFGHNSKTNARTFDEVIFLHD